MKPFCTTSLDAIFFALSARHKELRENQSFLDEQASRPDATDGMKEAAKDARTRLDANAIALRELNELDATVQICACSKNFPHLNDVFEEAKPAAQPQKGDPQ